MYSMLICPSALSSHYYQTFTVFMKPTVYAKCHQTQVKWFSTSFPGTTADHSVSRTPDTHYLDKRMFVSEEGDWREDLRLRAISRLRDSIYTLHVQRAAGVGIERWGQAGWKWGVGGGCQIWNGVGGDSPKDTSSGLQELAIRGRFAIYTQAFCCQHE